MGPSHLSKLPPELLRTIFSQLPVASLLALAQTNRANYIVATSVLTYLEVAIFPKSVHSVLAFLEEECREDIDDDDTPTKDVLYCRSSSRRRRNLSTWKRPSLCPELYQISYATQSSDSRAVSPSTLISGHDRKKAKRSLSPTKASPLSLRTAEFAVQNELATRILASRSIRYNVKSLTLHLYTMHSPALAGVLSSLSLLQHLNLNFSHAYINDTTLPASYWRSTPSQGSGSPLWNILAGIGPEASSSLKLRNLRTLTLRRAGITSYQLRSWIASNPCLREIVLEKVRGVDIEFTNWLAKYISDQSERLDLEETIDTVVLVDCSELVCKSAVDFRWINQIAKVNSRSSQQITTLSVRSCKNVDDTLFCNLAGLSDTPNSEVSNSSGSTSNDSDVMMEMEIDSPMPSQSPPWSQNIYRLVSPRGTLIKEGQRVLTHSEKQKMGMRSPALTISDVFPGTFTAVTPSGTRYRKWSRQEEEIIEVDPDLL